MSGSLRYNLLRVVVGGTEAVLVESETDQPISLGGSDGQLIDIEMFLDKWPLAVFL